MIWIISGVVAWIIAGLAMLRYLSGVDPFKPNPDLFGFDLLMPLILCVFGWPVLLILYGFSQLAKFIVTWRR